MEFTISLTGRLCIKTGCGIGDPSGGIARGDPVFVDRIRAVVGVVGATIIGTGAIVGRLDKALVSGDIAKSAPSNTIDSGVSPP